VYGSGIDGSCLSSQKLKYLNEEMALKGEQAEASRLTGAAFRKSLSE
jgi:hypothetical protein